EPGAAREQSRCCPTSERRYYFETAKCGQSMKVKRSSFVLRPDCSRVFFRPFELMSRERVIRILARVMSLTETEAERESAQVLHDFVGRHQRLRDFLLRRCEQVRNELPTDASLSEARRLL